jgi:dihydroorotate dehydrogenase (NAD+) catalytic subunit
MPWRRPRKTEEPRAAMRRSPEEAIEARYEEEELDDAVELAALDGATLSEAALGEAVDEVPTVLQEKLADALRGVELPEEVEETSTRPRHRPPKPSLRGGGPPSAGRSPTARGPSAAVASLPVTSLATGDVDLAVSIGSLKLRNPVMTASGCFGWGMEYAEIFAPSLLGALVTKGTTPAARPGNPQYRIAETPSGILNSIGLENPGAAGVAKKYAPQWKDLGVPVIVNVAGYSAEDYAYVVRTLDGLPGVAAFELNISCPNVEGGMLFGCDPVLASQVTAAVREVTELPLIVKLTPNAPDIVQVAIAVEEAGANALTCMNTILGMRIDPKTRRPVLGTKAGGLSGPAVRPIAVYLTYQLAQRVTIPIVGAGGVTSARDALEFMMAGATAIQVGTATFADPLAPLKVIEGLAEFTRAQRLSSIRQIVGAALPSRPNERPQTEYVDSAHPSR